MRERKISTTVQFTQEQFNSLDSIISLREDKPTIAKIIREALTFYVEEKYPQFTK